MVVESSSLMIYIPPFRDNFKYALNTFAFTMKVRASMDGTNKVYISEMTLRTSSGQTINVGSSGGGGGGGGSRRVIDVEGRVN